MQQTPRADDAPLELDITGGTLERPVSPAQQYGRKFSLIIGRDSGDALDLSAFRCVFQIERGDIQVPNSCRVRVYNLTRETAYRAMKEFKRLVLQAGYEGNYGIIFDGTIVQARFGRENQTDTYLDITAADGDSAYDLATIFTSLAAGSTSHDHINACVASMEPHGVSTGYIPEFESRPLPRGKVMCGMTRDFMRAIVQTEQSAWSIQDGKVQVVRETGYKPGDVIAVNSSSGMVGVPTQTQNGVTVRMLLNPYVKISQLIALDNRAVQQFEYSLALPDQAQMLAAQLHNKLGADGLYYVMVAKHWGDTRGNEWYTEATCLGADAVVAAEYLPSRVTPPANVVVVKQYP